MLAFLISLILALTGGGAVYLSQDALPGDALYGLKTSVEAIEMVMAPDKADKGLSKAQERLEEIQELAERGRYEDIPAAAERLADQLEYETMDNGEDRANTAGNRAVEALEAVLAKGKFPEQAVPAVTEAMEKIKDRLPSEEVPPIEPPIVPPPDLPVDSIEIPEPPPFEKIPVVEPPVEVSPSVMPRLP